MDNESTPSQLSSRQLFAITQAHLLNVVCIFGLLLNVASLVIFQQKSLRSRPFTVYHTALTICDIVLVCSAWPTLALNIMLNKGRMAVVGVWAPISWSSYNLMNCSMNVCILITVAATFERCTAIRHPLKALRQNMPKRTKVMLSSLIFFGIAYNVPKFWEFSVGMSVEDIKNSTRLVMRMSQFRHNLYYCIFYRLLGGVLVGSVLPISMVVSMGISIIKGVRRSRMMLSKRSSTTLLRRRNRASGSRSARRSTSNVHDRRASLQGFPRSNVMKAEISRFGEARQGQVTQISKMVTTHMIKFTVAYMVPTIIDMIEIYHKLEGSSSSITERNIRVVASAIGNFLVLLNSSTNFFLYVMFCKEFNSKFKMMFRSVVNIQIWLGSMRKGQYVLPNYLAQLEGTAV